jgi:ketopantoate reductase
VLGAGAIESIIGASVTRARHTLIDMWSAHVDQTRAHGLKVTAAEAGEFTVVLRNYSIRPAFWYRLPTFVSQLRTIHRP